MPEAAKGVRTRMSWEDVLVFRRYGWAEEASGVQPQKRRKLKRAVREAKEMREALPSPAKQESVASKGTDAPLRKPGKYGWSGTTR